MDFTSKLSKAINKNNSLVCVGLDPDTDKLNGQSIFNFNKKIIDETSDLVCAYKPNIAFYEALGIEGLQELKKTIDYIKENLPEIPIVLDAKRADVPNTAAKYAQSAQWWGADAVTVYPNLGYDSVKPFLENKEFFTIFIIKTSNDDSATFQNLSTESGEYYLAMAEEINKWQEKNFGIFCGATYPAELSNLRKIFPERVFLSAGVGSQGADIKDAVVAGVDKNGEGIIFNSSRSIIYSQNPKEEAKKLRDEINKYRK